MYLTGGCLGRIADSHKTAIKRIDFECRPLEFVGRHALAVYLVHQIALVGVLTLLLG